MIEIRALEREDLDRIREIRYHPEVGKWMISPSIPRSMRDQETWYEHISTSEKLVFVVCHEGEVVGYVQIGNVDWQHRNAEAGFAIDPECQGVGLGTEAVEWAVKFAFETLGLHSLSLEVLATNEKAIHVYEKCGFLYEGVLQERCWKSGKFENVVLMGVVSGL